MKISEKDKKLLILIGIIFIIAITYVNLFYTTSPFNNFFSVDNINSKKDTYSSEVSNISKNSEEIIKEKNNMENLKTQSEESSQSLSDFKNQINEEELTLDIPSFLIKVETIANNNNVTLNLQYDLVKLQNSDTQPLQDATQAETSADINTTVSVPSNDISSSMQDGITPNSDINNNSTQDINIDTDMSDMDISSPDYLSQIIENYEQPTVDGVKIASIPMAVTGTYDNVYKFLNDLSSIEYLQPGSLQIMSEGENIYCTIILNIFYK